MEKKLLILTFLFLLFCFKGNSQTTYDFTTNATLSGNIGTSWPWNTQANITIGGVAYRLTSGGNGSFTNATTGGVSNSKCLRKDGSGGDSFTLQRVDGQPFQFYGIWVNQQGLNLYSTFETIPPWYTLTAGSYTYSDMTTMTAGTAWNNYTYSSTSISPGAGGVTTTSVSINFKGINYYAIDNIIVGPAVVANSAPTNIALSASSINENVAANSTIGTLSSTDPDAANTFTYTLVAGTGSTDNAAFSISGSSLRITASPDFETKSSYSIRVRTTDQGSLFFEKTFTISINNVNETPTDIALSASAINENVAANSTIGALSSTDADAANTFTYTLVAGAGSTENASFSISGSNLTINASPNFETKSSYSIRVRTTDQGSLFFEKQFTITINNLNEAPTDIALTNSTVNENVAANTAVGTLSSTDPDAANTFTYTLVAGTGSTDNAAFSISGSSLRITASPDFETKSSYSIRVRTTDQGNLFFEKQFTITINNLNEAPTDIALSSSTVNENVAANTAVGTLSSTDVDAGNTFTYTLVAGTGDTDNAAFNISGNSLRITASPNFETKSSYSVRVRTADQGSLTFEKAFTVSITNVNEAPTDIALSASVINENVAANSTVGALSSTDVDTSSFTYSLVAGAGDTDNAAFTISGSDLKITASPDFETKASYAVRVRTFDGTSTFEKAFTITITNVNEAPTDIALSASTVNENVAANTTVGTLSSTDADVANTFIYTLVAGTGDTDNAAFNISGNSLRITASPDFETKASYSIRVRTSDGSLTFDKVFTITVNNVNEAPTDIALSSSVINENVAANSTVGTLSSTDPDAANTFIYTLVAGTGDTDNTAFNISGANLKITASPDFETKASYAVRIRTFDGTSTFEKAFTITITNVNEAPTDIALSASTVNENVAANTAVGTLSSTDADAANTFTYSLVSGTGDTDNAAFNISGNSLRITASPDFETKSSYSVRVRTTDQGGLTFEKAFTISITNVNEAPTDIALSASTVNENVAANTVVGTLSSTDADAANTFTYSLVSGTGDTDNAAFNISGNSLRITASPDFETKSSYSVRVRTTDQGGLTFEKAFTISITNVNEAPTDIALSASTVNENVAANTAVGTLSSTDVDAGNTFTYTLVAGTGDTDNASFNISGSNLRITASPDFETKSSYSVRVRTADQGGLTFEKAFTISITNVNEAPTDIALSASAINENVAANSTVGALSSTDVDTSSFTYSLVAGAGDIDNAAFTISGSDLKITASPDFETKASYAVRIRTFDGTSTFEKAFTITITNVNEAPTDIALTASTVNENVAANTTVGTLSSTNSDTANTFTYTLVSGTGDTDNATFNISDANLRITASPDFETKSSYSIRVRTTDQGSLTFEKVFTVSITNVNEAPTDIALSASAINENVAANSTVGALSSTDVDTSSFTYSLVAGAGDTDNAAFTISGSDLKITASPDFETKASYAVRIRTFDGTSTFEKAFTITITNVNEAPTDIALSASTVNENVAANTAVGTLSSTDVDAGNTFTYTLVAGTGDTDNASFNISGSNLRITASPDFETKSSYSIRVRTTDQGSLTFEKVFVITINDLCDLNNSVTQNSGVLTATQTGATYQWYNCSDNSTVGTNSNTFTPTQLGDYKVEITIGSCTVTSTCMNVNTLGTTNFEANAGLLIYPNPSRGSVNIQSSTDGNFQIVNQLGQVVKTFKVQSNSTNTIDVQNLSDSVYFIKEVNHSKSYRLIIKK